jgi:hypothetical protein
LATWLGEDPNKPAHQDHSSQTIDGRCIDGIIWRGMLHAASAATIGPPASRTMKQEEDSSSCDREILISTEMILKQAYTSFHYLFLFHPITNQSIPTINSWPSS